MDAFFQWLGGNPGATTALIAAFAILVAAVVLIYLVAFFQGREISLYPPRIGEKRDKLDSKSIFGSGEIEVAEELGQVNETRNVEGIWRSSYSVSEGTHTHNHVIELQQSGIYVTGRTLEGSSSPHIFSVKGVMRFGVYLVGIWESRLEGSIHHGVFQFMIDRKGQEMTGKWLGTSGAHPVNSGDWVLKKDSRNHQVRG